MFDWFDIEKFFRDVERKLNEMRNAEKYEWGWTFSIGPDGIPHMKEFGNPPLSIKYSNSREPYHDVIEEKDTIDITVELPGISKKDISLDLSEDNTLLHLSAKNDDRDYKLNIRLPSKVKDEPKKSTFKNGILNIIFEKDKSSSKPIKIN